MNDLIKMVQQFNPFVYWAQTESHATLKVDLKDVKVSIFKGGNYLCDKYGTNVKTIAGTEY